MANKADGRIVIDTEIDVSGAKQGVKNLTSEQIKVRNEYRKTAREIALLQEQIKEMETPKVDTSSLEKYEIEQTKITNEYKKTERQIALLEEQIKEMETPKIDTSSLEKYETKLQETYDKLADLEAQARAVENGINASIPVGTSKERLQDIYEHKKAWKDIQQAADKAYVEAEKYEKEIEKIKATTSTDMGTAKYEKAVNALATATEHLDMLGKKAKEVEARQLKVAESTSIGTAKYKKAVDALANAKERLDALGEKTKEVDAKQDKLVNKLKSVGREGRKNFRKASNSAQKFAVRLRSIVASAFIFNIISSGLRQLTSYMGNALKANKQFSASMSAIKGNLLTAFQPIYNAVMPALNSFMAGLQKVTGYIASFISTLFGTSVKASQESAKELYEQSSALDSVADSAKKANKQLSDIDELHVVNKSESIDSTSGSAGSNIVPSFGEIEVVDELPEWLEKSIENIKKLISDFKIGDYFAVGEDVSDLVIQISNYIAEAIASINWENVGKNVGAFLRGIKWLEVLKSLWGVLDAAITGAIKFYFGMLKEAPFETALMTAMALWKFTGVGNVLVGMINSALETALPKGGFSIKSALKVIFQLYLAFKLGDKIGSEIAKMLDDEVANILGDRTFFDYVFEFGFEEGLHDLANAMKPSALINFIKANGGTTEIEFNITAETKEFQEKIDKAVSSLDDFKTSSTNTLRNIDIEYENAFQTAQKYFELSQKDPSLFTEADLINLKDYKDTLEDYGILMTGSIDEVTNAWKGTNDELLKLIENQRNASKSQAYTDIIAEAQKQDITLRRDLQEAFDKFEDKDLLADLWTRFNKGQTKLNDKEIKKLAKQYEKTTDEIGNAMEAFNSLSKVYFAVAENQQYLNGISEEYIQFQKDMGYVSSDVSSDMLKDTRDVLDGITTGIHVTTDNLTVLADGTEENTVKVIDAMSAAGKAVENLGERTGQVSKKVSGMDFSIDVNTDEGMAKLEELDRIYDDIEKRRTTDITADTSFAINAVNTGVSVMNAGLSLIKTPSVNIETSTALSKAEILRNSIEAALTGINIGLKVDIQAKIKDAMTTAINIGKSAKVGIGEIKTYNPPYLASGAVIPPNKEFMAVLGDQKHGMNIEAPADLIKQMVKEGIAESGTTGDNDVNIYVYLEGDAEEVFRIVKVEHDKAKKQTGKSAFA